MNTLRVDFLKHATTIGGMRFRYFAWFIVVVVCSISFPLSITLINHKRWLGWMCLALSGSLVFGAIFLPFERWLSGFAIYRNDPSFLVRYGPEIGFAGLLASAVGVIIGVYQLSTANEEVGVPKKRRTKRTGSS